jgi:3-deoxy-D-manno-octulosonate 8-phosphate phosphatase (KDO 8-P phosphatase)
VASKVKTAARASRIRLLVLDVDGVLTDGVLVYGPSGEEIKRFHVRDGLAVQAARRAGIEVAVVSGRASAAVTRRMSELGIVEVHQGIADKAAELRALLGRLGITPEETAVMGDDLPDLPVMKIAGLALAPSDAAPEAKRAAAWVSRAPGGHGAVREAVEMLLRSRKAWPPRK